MTLPAPIFQAVTEFLQAKFSDRLRITGFDEVGGGCINHGGKLKTTDGDFFVKVNEAHRYPNMFEAEARGLKLLASAGTFNIPDVIGVVQGSSYQCIILTWIDQSNTGENFWAIFGRQLAQLHRHSHTHFGLDYDNYIGSLPQQNDVSTNWCTFFTEKRLQPLLLRLLNTKRDALLEKKFDQLFNQLPSLLDIEKPALVHGDLWRGNLITAAGGQPCLIDPAVYYGHREVDIAMTQLFGGFDPTYLQAYQEEFPLSEGWRNRLDIYNLYPLLVHLILFGDSYRGQILNILKKFV